MTSLDELIAQYDSMSAWKRRWWALRRVVRKVPDWPSDTKYAIKFAWQRLTRSWDDRSVWSLDTHLCKTLGSQLVYMADIAHGWPSEYPGEFDAWVADLRKYGEYLLEYNSDIDLVEQDEYDHIKGHVEEALAWVTENLGSLWD